MNYLNIREDLRTGKITRERFWEVMKSKHLNYLDFQSLLAKSELSGLEVTEAEILIVTKEGVRMVWDPCEVRSVPSVLVNYESHEKDVSPFLLAAAVGKDVIFDVGTNYGFYALHFASRIKSSGIIYAFEPIESTYKVFQRNIELNPSSVGKIVPVCSGLGISENEATFFYPEYSGSGAASLRELHPEEKNHQVTAKIEKLDNVFKSTNLSKLDLIKIDVEGAELFVLQGGLQTIKANKPLLFLELLRKWSKPFGYHPNEVITLLNELGYECWAFDNGSVLPFHQMTDETTQTNFMFTMPSHHPKPTDILNKHSPR